MRGGAIELSQKSDAPIATVNGLLKQISDRGERLSDPIRVVLDLSEQGRTYESQLRTRLKAHARTLGTSVEFE
jgi:hypothetical protein